MKTIKRNLFRSSKSSLCLSPCIMCVQYIGGYNEYIGEIS